ncbi:MAG: flagellar hook-length control protein FliK [Acidiferrobacterales bacterium]
MQISDNLSVQPAGSPGQPEILTAAWQVGQILDATVVDTPGPGQISLRIGGQLLIAQSQMTVQPGTVLALRVVSGGEQPTLAVATTPAGPDPQLQAWRVALPLQEPLPPLLNTVAVLASTQEQSSVTPGPAFSNIAGQVLGSLPDTQAVAHPAGLKAAMLNSGLYLESRLLAAANEAGGASGIALTDLKAGLLRLASALRAATAADPLPAGTESDASIPPPEHGIAAPVGNTPQAASPVKNTAQAVPLVQNSMATADNAAPPVQNAAAKAPFVQNTASTSPLLQQLPVPSAQTPLRQVEAALARLQMNQLSSLPAGHGGTPMWIFDLPVRHNDQIDVLRLQVEADDRHDGRHESRSWSVTLDLEPSNLGPVHARVTLNGDQISTTVWAEQPDTAALFTGHLDELRASMTRAGLTVAAMGCFCGKAPASGNARMPEKLLDTRA